MSESAALPGPGERFVRGILPENPTLRQLLGMCPTLAVTNTLAGALTMSGATIFVLVMSNLVTCLLRRLIQPHMRILVYTITIAAFVTVADRFLQAFMPAMSEKLGGYIPLIIVNCIIISRAEICASKQGPFTALCDALGMGAGFLLTLAAMGAIRELLGSGTLLVGLAGPADPGLRVMPAFWPNWVIMVLPPGAFLTLAVLIALVNWRQLRRQDAQAAQAAQAARAARADKEVQT